MLRESVDTDLECLNSSSKSENRSTLTSRVGIIDKILATSDACNASLSQSPRNEQNVTEMIECFNNQACLIRNTYVFEWWNKQAESDIERVANVALALKVTQGSVEEIFQV